MKQTTITRKRPDYNYSDPKSEHHYCQQFDTSFFKDSKLSSNSKLILAFLLSNTETYVNTTDTLKYNLGIGRDAIQRALKNLEDENYIRRTLISHGKSDISYSWKISAYPRNDFPPVTRKNNIDNLRTTENQSIENNINSFRLAENQLTENLQLKTCNRKPATENQPTYINKVILDNNIQITDTDNLSTDNFCDKWNLKSSLRSDFKLEKIPTEFVSVAQDNLSESESKSSIIDTVDIDTVDIDTVDIDTVDIDTVDITVPTALQAEPELPQDNLSDISKELDDILFNFHNTQIPVVTALSGNSNKEECKDVQPAGQKVPMVNKLNIEPVIITVLEKEFGVSDNYTFEQVDYATTRFFSW